MPTFLLLLPDFALIVLGVLLRRHMGLGDGFWVGLEKLVYFILFPALLFGALLRTQIDWGGAAPLFVCGLLTMVSGFLLGLAGRPFAGLSSMAFASRLQCAYRFNTYVGIAVAGKLHGAAGIAAMGPFANIMAVGMMARHGQGSLLRELSRNPLVLATVGGLLCNTLGMTLPVPGQQFLQRLADASITLGLLAVGAALRWGRSEGRWIASAWIIVIKLVILPLVTWALARPLGLEGLGLQVAVLFAALPSASSAYILAMRMGGDGPGVAWLISATTVLAAFTLSFWLAWATP